MPFYDPIVFLTAKRNGFAVHEIGEKEVVVFAVETVGISFYHFLSSICPNIKRKIVYFIQIIRKKIQKSQKKICLSFRYLCIVQKIHKTVTQFKKLKLG